MISFLKKYKDIILYLFFGGCTTIINVLVYYIFAHIINFSTIVSTLVAWLVAVLFAYITNRKWVFNSGNIEKKDILSEFFSFIICRLGTGVIDWGMMITFVDFFKFDDIIIKIISNIIVIILNYIMSKLIIFKKRRIKNV